jgi:hypothetical protein
MASKGRRRARLSAKALSIASIFFVFVAFAFAADAKSTSSSSARVPYSEPTPAEGGQTVRYNLTLGVAKKAPDCYREF